jgi:hypothetical protein
MKETVVRTFMDVLHTDGRHTCNPSTSKSERRIDLEAVTGKFNAGKYLGSCSSRRKIQAKHEIIVKVINNRVY